MFNVPSFGGPDRDNGLRLQCRLLDAAGKLVEEITTKPRDAAYQALAFIEAQGKEGAGSVTFSPIYDYRREGTPVQPRAPAMVKSTKPLTNVREIALGLYAGRDDRGELQIIDEEWHRGYVTRWRTPAKPDGYRVHTWAGRDRDRLEFVRTFPNRFEAERALIRQARKLAGAATAIAA
jgi:hypothetical protein